MEQVGQSKERRHEPRRTKVSDHRAEFKFIGSPVYQLKLRDLSSKGAGIVARADSDFLRMINTDQELVVKLISDESATVVDPGHYRARIKHISELKKGRFRGHMVVGISIHERNNSF